MDKVNVVFGRVVSGFDHIRAIEKLDTFKENLEILAREQQSFKNIAKQINTIQIQI